jgi:hypothetical protein
MRSHEGLPAGVMTFNENLKCCTFVPWLPNYAVGLALADDDDAASKGRDVMAARVDNRLGVTPLGIDPPALYQQIYTAGQPSAFGRAESLLCPHYDSGKCTMWKYRNSVCSTWFCQHGRGHIGRDFWSAVRLLLSNVEQAISVWCILELGVSDRVIDFLVTKRLHKAGREQLSALEIERRVENMSYEHAWDSWLGRESEFFIACGSLARSLTWEDVIRIAGPSLRMQATAVVNKFEALTTHATPERLTVGTYAVAHLSAQTCRLTPASGHDYVDLPTSVFNALSVFEGRSTTDATEVIHERTGYRFEPRVLQRLVDLGFLVAAS